jgi:hypothetical protein
MPDNRDPLLSPVSIHSLRPTQLTVGLIEVEEKRRQWDRLGDKKAAYLGQHMMPVVIGPKGRPYVIDHHHLARALHDEGQKKVLIQPLADLQSLSTDHFWRFLDNKGWLHPFDAHGKRQPYDAIPKRISHLQDDPFRSLAGGVRKAGGYAKDTTPFMEFIWADYFRRSFRARDIRNHWDRTLEEAVALARQHEARFMPGWCGPSQN